MEYLKVLQEIKQGKIRSVYLLYGPDAFIQDLIVRGLRDALFKGIDTPLDYHVLEDKSAQVGAALELARAVPFSSQRRLIVLKNPKITRREEQQLSEYLSSPLPFSCLTIILSDEAVSKSKWFKQAVSSGSVINCLPPGDYELQQWVRSEAAALGHQIEQEAIQFLIDVCGRDMRTLLTEMVKISTYLGKGQTITYQTVEIMKGISTHGSIFTLLDNVSNLDTEGALRSLQELHRIQEPPPRIVFMIARQLRLLLKARKLSGSSQEEIKNRLGVSLFQAKKLIRQARKLAEEDLVKGLRLCLSTDMAIKTGQMDPYLALQTLVVEFCSARQQTKTAN